MRLVRSIKAAKSALQLGGVAACVLTIGLTGCRHKHVLPPLPPVAPAMVLLKPPAPDPPPMIPLEQIDLPPVPVASSGGTPRRERRRKTTTQPSAATGASSVTAVDTPPPASPEETAIGALSLGGEASPQAQQEAADLLASIDRRLAGLPSSKKSADRAQISRIRNFGRQAQEALKSGDVEGAKTLATKARLLLDDLER
jgi:hypothetical protein